MLVNDLILLKWREPTFFRFRVLRKNQWILRGLFLAVMPAYVLLSPLWQEVSTTGFRSSLAYSLLYPSIFLLLFESWRKGCVTNIDVCCGHYHIATKGGVISFPLSTIRRAELFRTGAHRLSGSHPILVLHARYRPVEVIGVPDEKTLNALAIALRWSGVPWELIDREKSA